jgi:tRNA (guanine-N7-)-methyltransferase
MGQKKLIRFEELKTFPNVLEFPGEMNGKWGKFFQNENAITLELACGKGEYAVGLGQLYPDQNYIGIDLKGNRIWSGAKKALQLNLKNVAFLRIEIDQVADYFSANEVSAIWITFPDPQLRLSKAKKRLTHPKFLRLYRQFLIPGGLIHLKTDSPDLYDFTKQVIDLYGCILNEDRANILKEKETLPELRIKTHYESLDIAKSNRIHYLCFSLPQQLPGKEKDDELKQLLKSSPARPGESTRQQGRSPAAKEGKKELIENIDYYLNEDGLVVLTEKYHLERGYCCGSGCLHCPFDYESVEEPRRSALLSGKKKDRKK